MKAHYYLVTTDGDQIYLGYIAYREALKYADDESSIMTEADIKTEL